MPFDEILPRGGRRANTGLTVSWLFPKRGSPGLSITIGAALCTKLGIVRGTRLKVLHDATLGVLRLCRAEGQGWACRYNGTYAKLHIPIDSVVLQGTKPAQGVPHTAGPDNISLTLPDWAAPGRVAVLQTAQARQGRAA